LLAISFIFVGRTKEEYFTKAQDEYIKRLRSFCVSRIIELPERKLPDKPSAAQTDAALLIEAGEIMKNVPTGAFLIPMCVEGRQKSSENLANLLLELPSGGISKICFVIGGSFGLHDTVKNAGNLRLSLSEMTLPHSLARVVLLEQVYRAFSIISGSKYHK